MFFIKILGQLLEVHYIPQEGFKPLMEGAYEDSTEYYGLFLPLERRIYILNTLKGEALKRTLIHEIVHAYIRIAGYNELIPHDQEEALCTLLENMLELFTNETFTSWIGKPNE